MGINAVYDAFIGFKNRSPSAKSPCAMYWKLSHRFTHVVFSGCPVSFFLATWCISGLFVTLNGQICAILGFTEKTWVATLIFLVDSGLFRL